MDMQWVQIIMRWHLEVKTFKLPSSMDSFTIHWDWKWDNLFAWVQRQDHSHLGAYSQLLEKQLASAAEHLYDCVFNHYVYAGAPPQGVVLRLGDVEAILNTMSIYIGRYRWPTPHAYMGLTWNGNYKSDWIPDPDVNRCPARVYLDPSCMTVFEDMVRAFHDRRKYLVPRSLYACVTFTGAKRSQWVFWIQ